MSFELISIIVFLGSFFTAASILIKKIPVLAQLPEKKYSRNEWNIFIEAKRKYLIDYFGKIRYEVLLQKILSRICILTLKTERKVNQWLQRLREKEKNKKVLDYRYWDKFTEKVSRRRVRTPR